ncbi:uncharacterized protein LOC107410678 isoform X2 [Ziziphus jujuba]|nr:uncharacterized protein LOC107410678 isoform X2 [Ziziphus jujuba]XP_048326808.1 uncharacterized protein LOC107410678 isoform X2 [Ziziphus jujuba]XP_048326812.1 uncharacterized protein LOC107410678 isoform X2 [Ziziphus jujuba]XP_048326818.1 uncharacterized protein LOC107410678 isoform X2 [Ziziphus jujuba]KAH7544956.1 hypothetical protein FEM48_Zijuj01G0041000 [Ziziphus jujuba var. spinosa]
MDWMANIYEKIEATFLELEEVIEKEIYELSHRQLETNIMKDVVKAVENPVSSLVPDTNDVKSKGILLLLSSTESLKGIPSGSPEETVDITEPKCLFLSGEVFPEESNTSNLLFIEPKHMDLETELGSGVKMLQSSPEECVKGIFSEETSNIVKAKRPLESDVISHKGKDTSNECHHVNLETESDNRGKTFKLSSVESVNGIHLEEPDDIVKSQCLLKSDVVFPEEKDASKEPLFNETHLVDLVTELNIESESSEMLPPASDGRVYRAFVKTGENNSDLVEAFVHVPESSDGCILEEGGDNDINQEVFLVVKSADDLKLDGSCILVDSSKVDSSAYEAEKPWSYKKKIRYVASKLRLAKKQDCCSQAKQRGDINGAMDHQQGHENSKLCQYEWEII